MALSQISNVDITYKSVIFSESDFRFCNVKNVALQHDLKGFF